ncbi:MAG: carbohydrate porin [Planctomycetaceae bacterium]
MKWSSLLWHVLLPMDRLLGPLKAPRGYPEIIRRFVLLCNVFVSSVLSTSVIAQEVGRSMIPVPGCPGRGLLFDSIEGLEYSSTRQMNCCRSNDSALAAEGTCGEGSDWPATLFPEEWHNPGPIQAECIYTGEIFSNTRGGLNVNDATRYRGNLDIVLTGHSEQLGLWEHGHFFVYGSSLHGRTLAGTDTGDYQFYSNIDGSPRPDNVFQITEYWYEHEFLDGAVAVKLGKQDANADFAYVELGGSFINTSLGLIPTVPLPTWPNPGFGLALFASPGDLVQFKFGLYDGSPSVGYQSGGRWALSTIGDNGAFAIAELLLTPRFGVDEELPASIRTGVWFHTGRFENTNTGQFESGNHGIYIGYDQMLWSEGADAQGFGGFAQFGYAPAELNSVRQHWGGGLVYRGLFSGRDDDELGLGFSSVRFSDSSLRSETAVELFYQATLTPFAVIQPDIQYIASPSGNIRDALVVGLRTEIVL